MEQQTRIDLAPVLKISQEEDAVLTAGSNHKFLCRCKVCLAWWVMMGPQDGDSDDYGPFSSEEIKYAKIAGGDK